MDQAPLAIVQRIADMLSTSWNSADGAAFAQPFTDSADFVSIFATSYSGRSAVAKQHQTIFDGVYRGSTITFTASHARALADDILLAHVKAKLRVPQGPMAGVVRTLATAVLVRSDDEWQIDSFHNTQERNPGAIGPTQRP